MTQPLIRLAMAGALAAGLALAQTPATAPQTAPAGKVKTAKALKTRALRKAVQHRMLKALGLSEPQKQQAKALFQQTKTANQPLRAQLRQNRQALSAAVKANDIGQIRQLTQVQGSLKGQLMASRSEALAKFYTTLTPDQKSKMDQIQQKVRQRVAAKRNNG